MSEAANEFVSNAKELPVMAPVAAEVMKKAEDPETELPSIAALISRDASLAVRVLKIANSSFYSMPRKIETLQQAIVLLGFSTLRSVVIAASMKDVFSRFGLAERLLWEHAVAGGVAAGVLAQEVGGIARDEAFVGGLLHDIGKLVMHSQSEQQYQEVMKVVYADEKEASEAETDVFGFDHAEVGELLLDRWKIPARLGAAVGAHHDLSRCADVEGAKPVAALIQVADLICLREGLGRRKPNSDLNPLDCPGGEVLGIQEAELEELLSTFREAYNKERDIFA